MNDLIKKINYKIIIWIAVALVVIILVIFFARYLRNKNSSSNLPPLAPGATNTAPLTAAYIPSLVKSGVVCSISGNSLILDASGDQICDINSANKLTVNINAQTKIIDFNSNTYYGANGLSKLVQNDGVKVYSSADMSGKNTIEATEIDVSQVPIVTTVPSSSGGTRTAITIEQNTPTTLPTAIFNIVGTLEKISGDVLTVSVAANSLFPNRTGNINVEATVTPNTNVFTRNKEYTGLAGAGFLMVGGNISVQSSANIYEQTSFNAINIRQ